MSGTYERSLQAYDAASAIPGRSSTRSKNPGNFFDIGRGPLYAASGLRCWIFDADGNKYVDMLCALGAVSLGYDEAVIENRHGSYSLPTRSEGACAEQVLSHVAPWATHVRFARTGSEATHAAYRIAKRATGRRFVLVGDWAYHGWHEWCERKPDRTPELDTTILYGHGANLDDVLTEHGLTRKDVAAVFVEPHRWEAVDRVWLAGLRSWCDSSGALLVFDEMIYGGRWHLQGSTHWFGVVPHLACFGKALGNGAPWACVVGTDAVENHGQVVSGTFSGDVSSLEAAVATIKRYVRDDVASLMWSTGSLLRAGMNEAIASSRWSDIAFMDGAAVHQRLKFDTGDAAADMAALREFCAQMAARSVLWHPACVNVSASHTEAAIEHVCEAAADSLVSMEHMR